MGGRAVIRVTRLRGDELVVNAELIETVESTPDTVISLTTGRRLVVAEPADEVVRRVIAYKLLILHPGEGSAPWTSPP